MRLRAPLPAGCCLADPPLERRDTLFLLHLENAASLSWIRPAPLRNFRRARYFGPAEWTIGAKGRNPTDAGALAASLPTAAGPRAHTAPQGVG